MPSHNLKVFHSIQERAALQIFAEVKRKQIVLETNGIKRSGRGASCVITGVIPALGRQQEDREFEATKSAQGRLE